MAEEKVALFDFCGTMINFQSADAYVQFVKEHVPHDFRMNFIEFVRKIFVKSQVMRVLEKLNRRGSINKKTLLREIQGLSQSEMEKLAEKFYHERIRPNYIPEVIEAVKKYHDEGYKLLIVSGGYDIYLKYVAEEFGFNDVLATCLEFRDGKFTGHYKGEDCMNKHKVTLLKEYFGREDLRDCNSVAYSDSRSDVPMMKFCRRGIAVLQKLRMPPPRNYLDDENGLMLTVLRCSHGRKNTKEHKIFTEGKFISTSMLPENKRCVLPISADFLR